MGLARSSVFAINQIGSVKDVQYHAEIVGIVELALAWLAIVSPMTHGIHMLLNGSPAVEASCASVTFPVRHRFRRVNR